MSQPSSFRQGGPATPNNQQPPSYVELQRLQSSDAPLHSDPASPTSGVRTKDGRHSPYTAKVIHENPSYPMLHLAGAAAAVPQAPGSTGGASAGGGSANFAPGSSPNMPPSYSEAYGRAAVHTALSGHCAFVPIPIDVPPYRELPVEDPTTLPPPLFLGQLRFETTASEIRYLLGELSGVEPVRIEPRGNACWVAQLKCELDNDAVRLLHKKVLFDIPGVWVAETNAEVDALRQYTALHLGQMSRKAHLPRDCLVVEEARGATPNSGPAAPPAGAGPQPLSLLQSLNNLPPYHQPPGFVERTYRGQRSPQRPDSGTNGALLPAPFRGSAPNSTSSSQNFHGGPSSRSMGSMSRGQ